MVIYGATGSAHQRSGSSARLVIEAVLQNAAQSQRADEAAGSGPSNCKFPVQCSEAKFPGPLEVVQGHGPHFEKLPAAGFYSTVSGAVLVLRLG